jgi:hypothetical protein
MSFSSSFCVDENNREGMRNDFQANGKYLVLVVTEEVEGFDEEEDGLPAAVEAGDVAAEESSSDGPPDEDDFGVAALRVVPCMRGNSNAALPRAISTGCSDLFA